MRIFWCIFLVLVLPGCSDPEPPGSQIRKDFLALHKDCEPISIIATEGDFHNVWMQVKYTCNDRSEINESNMLYRWENNKWGFVPTSSN
jgi:hypothetical protein